MIPKEILVVNDGSLLLQVMGCLLETRGYRLRLTDSPEEALILLNTRNVHLLLIKINGEQIDRFSLLYMVKELNIDTKLIIMADEAYLPAEIFEIEADDYILLPCRIAEIWRRLSIYLEPTLRKPEAFREKSLVHLVNRQIFKNLSLMFHDMQGQAAAIAQCLNALKLNLNGKVEGEAAAIFQETCKKTQTMIGMAAEGFHKLLNAKVIKTSPVIIDLEEDAVPPAVKGAWERMQYPY